MALNGHISAILLIKFSLTLFWVTKCKFTPKRSAFSLICINIGITPQLATKSRRKRENGTHSAMRGYKFYANLRPHRPTPKAAKLTLVGGNL